MHVDSPLPGRLLRQEPCKWRNLIEKWSSNPQTRSALQLEEAFYKLLLETVLQKAQRIGNNCSASTSDWYAQLEISGAHLWPHWDISWLPYNCQARSGSLHDYWVPLSIGMDKVYSWKIIRCPLFFERPFPQSKVRSISALMRKAPSGQTLHNFSACNNMLVLCRYAAPYKCPRCYLPKGTVRSFGSHTKSLPRRYANTQ